MIIGLAVGFVVFRRYLMNITFFGLVQDCNDSSALAVESQQSCSKPSILDKSILPFALYNFTNHVKVPMLFYCLKLMINYIAGWLQLVLPSNL